MKRYFFLLLLAGASLAFIYSPTAHRALPPTTNYTVTELIVHDTVLSGTCLGEDIHVLGTVHVVHHLSVTGNRYVEKVVHNAQGVTAVGLTTGSTYRGVGVTIWTAAGSFANGQAITSYLNNYYFIGLGRSASLFMHDNVQTTINANGTVTSVVEHSDVECR